MRRHSEWDESYVLSMAVVESDTFEAKGARALDLTLVGVDENRVRKELSIAISAFANTGGGTIVFGLRNPAASDAQWMVDEGGVSLSSPKGGTREWLEDVIPHLVENPLPRFNVYAIHPQQSGSQIAPGKALMVVEIGDSDNAPHMAVDNRYYARVAGKSRPLGHRLVMDIANRRKHPQLTLSFSIERYTEHEYDFAANKSIAEQRSKIRIECKNDGRVLAQYVACQIAYPLYLLPQRERDLWHKKDSPNEVYIRTFRNTERDIVDVKGGIGQVIRKYGPSWFSPILPGTTHEWELDLDPDIADDRRASDRVTWSLYADNAPPQHGSITLDQMAVADDDE